MRRALLHWSVGTAWLAVAWAVASAGLHVGWALGSSFGRTAGPEASTTYEVGLALGCVAIGTLALALAVGVRGGLGALAYSGARLVGVLLAAIGAVGVLEVLWDLAGDSPVGAGAAWPPWLLLGGLLFLGAGPWPRPARPRPAGDPRASGAAPGPHHRVRGLPGQPRRWAARDVAGRVLRPVRRG